MAAAAAPAAAAGGLDHDEFSAWLRLLETPGVGRDSARALLARFGSPQGVLAASINERKTVVSASVASALAEPPREFEARLAAGWQWLQGGSGDGEVRGDGESLVEGSGERRADVEARTVVTVGDTRYPRALLESGDPPLLLYARGRVELLDRPSVAIVGSRNPTPQGLENARAFAAHLSREGWVVVSGLALGIDGAAHEGALEGASDGGGGTIAVVGTGLDRVYPARHRALARRIAESGLIVSEFSIGTPALPENFPVRNRIIAGLARGTVVVEAALKSGSLITARLAAESGRDVFAIPGSIHSPLSRGCHALIKQGAKLVDSGADIVDELGPRAAVGAARADADANPDDDANAEPENKAEPARVPEDPLLTALGFEPMALEELIARTGRSAADLSAHLLDLELLGRVARLPGQLYQRIERA